MNKLSVIQKIILVLLIPLVLIGVNQFYSEHELNSLMTDTEQSILNANLDISQEELDLTLDTTDSFKDGNYWSRKNWVRFSLYAFTLFFFLFVFKKKKPQH